jgi:TolB-like protein
MLFLNNKRDKLIIVVMVFLFSLLGLSAAEKFSIAVMDFKVTNIQKDEVDLLIDYFNHSLFQTGIFDVVQKDKRDKLLKEIEFSVSDVADHKKTKELGKLLSAKLLIFGSVGKLGSNIIFNLSVVDVETGSTVSSYSKTYAKLEEIVNDLPLVSENVANAAMNSMFMKKAQMIYYDNFNAQTWVVSDVLFYKNGKYHIYKKDNEWYVWENITVDDFVIEVETQWIEGSDNSGYGLIFRLQDENNYYIFDITKTGFFKLDKRVDGSYIALTDWEKSNAINDKGVNYLKVIAVGKHLTVFINNIKVTELNDSAFPKGKFGLFAGSGVHAAFDNLMVYQGNLVLYDNFSEITDTFTQTDQAYTKNGEYTVKATDSDYYSWGGEDYENFSFRAQARWQAGPADSGYGLTFRFKDIDNHYLFIILKSGYYRFGYYKDAKWNVLIDWKKTRLINPEGKNILQVVCMGSTYRLFINDNLVDEYDDATFMKGRLGFFSATGITAVFDNVELFEVEY